MDMLTIERIGKALHQYHGRGYCTLGAHDPRNSYTCWEEAQVVLLAIDGQGPRDYPQRTGKLTLSARKGTKK
jgi:hypothetical protein